MIERYQNLLSLDWNLLFTLITVIVLILILRKFLFKKVHKFMEDRENEVIETLENAEKTSNMADQKLVEYQNKLDSAEEERREIIVAAKEEARIEADKIITEAKEKAEAIHAKSKLEIERDRIKAEKQLKQEMSELIVLAANKALENKESGVSTEELVDRIVKDA